MEPLKSSLATRFVQPYRPAAVPSEPLEVLEAGVVDAGVVDAGVVDAGVVDAGVVEAGVVDAGVVDAEVEVEDSEVVGLDVVEVPGSVVVLGSVDSMGAGVEDAGTGEGQSVFCGPPPALDGLGW